jgi:hypothetical protein
MYPGEDRYPRIAIYSLTREISNLVESGNPGADTHLLLQVHHRDLETVGTFCVLTPLLHFAGFPFSPSYLSYNPITL